MRTRPTTPVLLLMMILPAGGNTLSQPVSVDRAHAETVVGLLRGNDLSSRIPLQQPGETPAAAETRKDLRGIRSLYTWVLKFSMTGKVFKDVSFSNPQTGYVVTELGAVYKTTDGGGTWQAKLNLGFPYYWYGVDALTADTVVIAGFNNQGNISTGVVRWSYDGGNSWGQDIVLRIPSGVGWLDRVHFFNRDTGIVMASFSGGVHYTTNGGKDTNSWTYVQVNQDLGWFAGNVDAQRSGDVYATGIHFAHSTDFGLTWSSMPSADFTFDGGVDFLDDNRLFGWTGGGEISPSVEGWIHRTTDGGQTWSSRLNTFAYPIRALQFFTENLGLAVGGNVYGEVGGIHSTTDGGLTWTLDVSTNAEMFSIDTIRVSNDSIDIWCAGSTGGSTGFVGKLYKARAYFPSGPTGVTGGGEDAIAGYRLYDNYPNPFNPTTTITYDLPRRSQVTLKILDVLGQVVSTLVDGVQEQGHRSTQWNAAGIASGVYFCRLETTGFVATKSLLLIK